MPTFTEAQILAWLTPILWPFLRVLALFTTAPVLSLRSIPVRVKLLLALLVAVSARAGLPPPPDVSLDSAAALGMAAQQVIVGLTIGFAARVVFAGVELAGELIGLQMGLSYATFFDPGSNSSVAATTRFFSTMASLLFIVMNGHLLMTFAVIRSFDAFPIDERPLAFISTLQPQAWGSELFQLGVWIALPIVSMILLINFMLGIVSRVASQMQIFAIGFPITLATGLVGMAMTLPIMQAPFTVALERMLALFQ